ncbi:MAG: hypothetical protein IJW82_02620 [Clostridia bacterium]|nr:hypothetical protein [Clostridia bacterium]
MKCYKKEDLKNVFYTLFDCEEKEIKMCEEFLKKYQVFHIDLTYELYGVEQKKVTLSEHKQYYKNEDLICIIENENVKGCVCRGICFYINGKKEYKSVEKNIAQGPLIWKEEEWRLEKI